MAGNMHEILRQALSLPEAERAEVAGALIESIEPSPDLDVEQAWREEVTRRSADVHAGRAKTVPWEVVREQLYARLRATHA